MLTADSRKNEIGADRGDYGRGEPRRKFKFPFYADIPELP
jgi:hypothetical protein